MRGELRCSEKGLQLPDLAPVVDSHNRCCRKPVIMAVEKYFVEDICCRLLNVNFISINQVMVTTKISIKMSKTKCGQNSHQM